MTAASACPDGPTTVGYALHALEPAEEQRVEAHLPGCAACRDLMREVGGVTALLAAAVPAADPPPRLRDRLLARAGEGAAATNGTGPDAATNGTGPDAETSAVPTTGPDADADASPGPDDAAAAPAPAAPSRPAGSSPSRPGPARPGGARPPGRARSGRRRRWLPAVVAAAVLGVVLVSVRVLLPGGDAADTTARAEQIVQDARAQDPAAREATLRAPDGTPVGVVVDGADGLRLVPLGLAPAAGGSTYVLWRVAGQDPEAVGLVGVDGTTRQVPAAAPAAGPVTAYAMSVEPAGTVPDRPSVVVADGAVV